MADYKILICWDQSNGEGRLNKSNAPAGMFQVSSNIINNVYQFDGTNIEPFDVGDTGSTGNGHSWVGDNQSDNCYAAVHVLAWWLSQYYSTNIIICAVTNGGSILRLGNTVNGSHNTDVATLAGSHPTTPILHTALVDKYNALIAELDSNLDTYEVLAQITTQGEADADALNLRATHLPAKIDAVRTLVGNANLPTLLLTQSYDSNYHRPYSNKVAFDLAAGDSNIHAMNGYNLPTFDSAHYEAIGILDHAKWGYKKITGEDKEPETVTITAPAIIGSTFDYLDSYLEAANVTDSLEQQCAEALYDGLRANNDELWDLSIGFYPMLGTDYTKNLRSGGLYRPLVLTGATQVATGLNFDGTNDFAATNFRVQDRVNGVADFNISLYLQDNSTGDGNQGAASWAGTNFGRFYAPFFSSPNQTARGYIGSSTVLGTVAITNNQGLLDFGVKGGNFTITRNGSVIRTVAYSTNHFVNNPINFGKDFDDNEFLNNIASLLTYGLGLTDAQRASRYTMIQAALAIIDRDV